MHRWGWHLFECLLGGDDPESDFFEEPRYVLGVMPWTVVSLDGFPASVEADPGCLGVAHISILPHPCLCVKDVIHRRVESKVGGAFSQR